MLVLVGGMLWREAKLFGEDKYQGKWGNVKDNVEMSRVMGKYKG